MKNQCKSKTRSGEPCRAAATVGGLCFFHSNPNKAAELGRIGGRKKHHIHAENLDPLPTLDSALAVRQTVDRLIAEVLAGKRNPRTAASLAPLLNLQLRAIETSDVERRLAELEKLAAQSRGQIPLSDNASARAETGDDAKAPIPPETRQ